MHVNMIQLFTDYNISYWTSGKNVQDGWINIQCPFCNDPSNHLGYNTDGDYFNCWNCGQHPVKQVLKRLLNISYYEIDILLYDYSDYRILLDNLNKKSIVNKSALFTLPGEEKLSRPCIKYLRKRKFNPWELQEKYKIRDGGIVGEWRYRLIIPVYFNKKPVTFQARSYSKQLNIKYKSLGKNKSLINIKNILYNLDNCTGDNIAIMEGVFDVFRFGDNCCCCFGTVLTDYQIKFLTNYKKIFFVYDPETEAQQRASNYAKKFAVLGKYVEVINIGKDGDPAELCEKEVSYIKKELKL